MYPKIKRLLDLVFSSICIVIGAIPMLIVAIIVKIDSPGPAIFKQDRLGVGGKPFKFYKFRSMVVNAEHTGSGVYSGKGDSRITRIGRILRATSIDEVPQLFNIFKGDMSFIGERDIIVTTKKNIVFQGLLRLIQFRYKVLYITVGQAETADENKMAS